jgi:hypothetical protein
MQESSLDVADLAEPLVEHDKSTSTSTWAAVVSALVGEYPHSTKAVRALPARPS